MHRFAVEWDPWEIRWLVDGQLVHRRVNWEPTPIPHLPMTLHVNTWPSRSRELAGRVARRRLPAATVVRSIAVDAYRIGRANSGRSKAVDLVARPRLCESEKTFAPLR